MSYKIEIENITFTIEKNKDGSVGNISPSTFYHPDKGYVKLKGLTLEEGPVTWAVSGKINLTRQTTSSRAIASVKPIGSTGSEEEVPLDELSKLCGLERAILEEEMENDI